MNNTKEKLVEILDNFPYDLKDYAGNNKVFMVDDHIELADHLIASGVTVRERGRWEWITEDVYGCNNCGATNHVKEVMGQPDFNFCPVCGADMRGDNP